MQRGDSIRAKEDDAESAVLGLFNRALDLLELIPQGSFRDTQIIVLRLIVCTAVKDWITGLKLCDDAIGMTDIQLRRSISQFYLAYAKHLSSEGRPEEARIIIWRMEGVSPECSNVPSGGFAAGILESAQVSRDVKQRLETRMRFAFPGVDPKGRTP
jgi:hypothetical protein